MADQFFRIYCINAVLLITHEIDSAYWEESELFQLPGGINGFLLLHFPLIFFVMYGLVLLNRGTTDGLVLSVVLSLGGLFAFSIHQYFLRKGHEEFNTPLSQLIL